VIQTFRIGNSWVGCLSPVALDGGSTARRKPDGWTAHDETRSREIESPSVRYAPSAWAFHHTSHGRNPIDLTVVPLWRSLPYNAHLLPPSVCTHKKNEQRNNHRGGRSWLLGPWGARRRGGMATARARHTVGSASVSNRKLYH
jgi:hypothetical protein